MDFQQTMPPSPKTPTKKRHLPAVVASPYFLLAQEVTGSSNRLNKQQETREHTYPGPPHLPDEEIPPDDPLFSYYFRTYLNLYRELETLKPMLIQGASLLHAEE
jgi:hypothetical protein